MIKQESCSGPMGVTSSDRPADLASEASHNSLVSPTHVAAADVASDEVIELVDVDDYACRLAGAHVSAYEVIEGLEEPMDVLEVDPNDVIEAGKDIFYVDLGTNPTLIEDLG